MGTPSRYTFLWENLISPLKIQIDKELFTFKFFLFIHWTSMSWQPRVTGVRKCRRGQALTASPHHLDGQAHRASWPDSEPAPETLQRKPEDWGLLTRQRPLLTAVTHSLPSTATRTNPAVGATIQSLHVLQTNAWWDLDPLFNKTIAALPPTLSIPLLLPIFICSTDYQAYYIYLLIRSLPCLYTHTYVSSMTTENLLLISIYPAPRTVWDTWLVLSKYLLDGWMHGWMHRWMHGWVNKWTTEWTDTLTWTPCSWFS